MPSRLAIFRSSRAGAAALLMQRAPLLKLLPEARILTSSTFTDALRWTVTAVAGLGAFDTVAGASVIVQLQPSANSLTVPGIAGDPLTFVWQVQGTPAVPSLCTISGDIPTGMTHSMLTNSSVDNITGIPTEAGTYPIVVTAWRFPDQTGDNIQQAFTLQITNPPPPQIQTPPAGGIFTAGNFVKLTAQHSQGRSFTWNLNGEPLELENRTLFARTAPRRYRRAPATDPGTAWRSGDAFDDSTWTAVSGGVGYDTSASPVNYVPQLATPNGNIQTLMTTAPAATSLHMRLPFTLPAGAALSYLKLRYQCDDGFVAWINGTEVTSLNKPANLQWNSSASGQPADATAVTFLERDISSFAHLLRTGQNLLAIQAMNVNTTSSDFLFNCELEAGINDKNSATLVLPALQLQQSGAYTVTVSNAAGSVTSPDAGVYILPTLLQQPASDTIPHNTSTTLHTTATGTDPITYQWYQGTAPDTSNPVNGATEESFTTPLLTATTSYWVRATNPGGSTDSTTATLTVEPPAIQDYTHWSAAQFTPAQLTDPLISAASADPDGDGFTNAHEYALGTPPLTSSGSGLELTAPATLSFTAQPAAGPGYTGRSRLYTLESTTNLTTGPWVPVPGFENLPASGQTLTHPLTAPGYFRLRVTLTP